MIQRIVISVLIGTTSALASTINVPGDHTSIQAAADASSNGDVILVAPGTYAGFSFGDKTVTIRASGSAEETIVNGNGQCGVITIWGNDGDDVVTLEGLTVTGGRCDGGDDFGFAAGLSCFGSRLNLIDCIVSDNTSEGSWGGGGLQLGSTYGWNIVISGCTFADNSGYQGGGINISDSHPTITNCIFTGNTATTGGDIYVYYNNSNASVSNSTFCGNGSDAIIGPYSGSGNTFLDECAPDPPGCTGDVDGSDAVDVDDISTLISHWDTTDATSDLNEDGLVGVPDLLMMLAAWGACS